MLSIRQTIALSALAFFCAQSVSAGFFRSRNNGRVSGLAVSIIDQVANGGGKDVDIRVDMTTIRTIDTGTDIRPLRGGNPLSQEFTVDEVNSSRSGFGGLGDADLASTVSVSDTMGRPFSNFFYSTNPRSLRGDTWYSGVALQATFRNAEFTEGELPALDYGDGSTVDVDTLSPLGSPTTTTSGSRRTIRNRWRGTFTHTYPDLGSYTVTAASRCCPFEVFGMEDDDDTFGQRGFADFSVSPGYVVQPNSPSALQFSNSFSVRLEFQSAYTTAGPERGTPATGTFTIADGGGGTGVFSPEVAQVTNTALVEDGLGGFDRVLQIPTANTYGLAFLSLLLAAAGFFTLRR